MASTMAGEPDGQWPLLFDSSPWQWAFMPQSLYLQAWCEGAGESVHLPTKFSAHIEFAPQDRCGLNVEALLPQCALRVLPAHAYMPAPAS